MSHEGCRHMLSSLSQYVDGELDETLCAEIERHMAGCENCTIVVDTLRKTVSLYQETAPDPEVPGEVRRRLYQCLNLEDLLDRKE